MFRIVAPVLVDPDGVITDPVATGYNESIDLVVADADGVPGEMAELLEQAHQAVAAAVAMRQVVIAAIGDAIEVTPGGGRLIPFPDPVTDTLAAQLTVSRRSAEYLRSDAEMCRLSPRVWAALAQGRLDAAKARVPAPDRGSQQRQETA